MDACMHQSEMGNRGREWGRGGETGRTGLDWRLATGETARLAHWVGMPRMRWEGWMVGFFGPTIAGAVPARPVGWWSSQCVGGVGTPNRCCSLHGAVPRYVLGYPNVPNVFRLSARRSPGGRLRFPRGYHRFRRRKVHASSYGTGWLPID